MDQIDKKEMYLAVKEAKEKFKLLRLNLSALEMTINLVERKLRRDIGK